MGLSMGSGRGRGADNGPSWASSPGWQPPGEDAPPAGMTEARGSGGGVPLVEVAAVGLLAGGVGVGVASFLPAYVGGSSLASQSMSVLAHALPLAGWALAAVLLVLRARTSAPRLPVGFEGALGIGVAAVELGLVLADIGAAVSGSSAGPGLVLSVIEWGLCSVGSVLALHPFLRRQAPARRQGRADPFLASALVLVGLATAALFAPPWDRYVVDLSNAGRSVVVTAGNAFAEPAAVIAGNVVAMVAIAAVAIAAAFLRRARLAAGLLAGAVIVLVGQVASALAQWRSPVPSTQFGLSPSRAAALGFHVDAGFTAAFYGFSLCVALLAVLAAGRAAGRAGATPADAEAASASWPPPPPSWPAPQGPASWAPLQEPQARPPQARPSWPAPQGPASWPPPPPSWPAPQGPASWPPPSGQPLPIAPQASQPARRAGEAPRRPPRRTPHY